MSQHFKQPEVHAVGEASSFATAFSSSHIRSDVGFHIGAEHDKHIFIKDPSSNSQLEKWAVYPKGHGFENVELIEGFDKAQRSGFVGYPCFVYVIPVKNEESLDGVTLIPFIPSTARINPVANRIHKSIVEANEVAYQKFGKKLEKQFAILSKTKPTKSSRQVNLSKLVLPSAVVATAAIVYASFQEVHATSLPQPPKVTYNPNITKQKIKTAFSKIDPELKAIELIKISNDEFKSYCIETDHTRFKNYVHRMISELPNHIYYKYSDKLDNLWYIHYRFVQSDWNPNLKYTAPPQTRRVVSAPTYSSDETIDSSVPSFDGLSGIAQTTSDGLKNVGEAISSIDTTKVAESLQKGIVDRALDASRQQAKQILFDTVTNPYVGLSILAVLAYVGFSIRSKINLAKKIASSLIPGSKK
jgi:hypothetical protein